MTTDLDAHIIARLGKVPDSVLAAETNLHTETIRRERLKRGIGASRQYIQWTPERDAVLGTASDAAIAKQLGVTRIAVTLRDAPVLMRVGAPLREESPANRIVGAWRPKIHRTTVAKMRRLRATGMTIGDVARTVRVSYRTTQQYLATSPAATNTPP